MLVPLPMLTTAWKGLSDVPMSVPLVRTVTFAPDAEAAMRLGFPAVSSLDTLLMALMITLSAVILVLVPIFTLALLVIRFFVPAPVPANAARVKLSAEESTS